MRTTIRIDEDLLEEAKGVALATGRTLNALIEDALREVLARRKSAGRRKPVRLPTSGSGGTLPGVNLDSSEDLLELMEGRR